MSSFNTFKKIENYVYNLGETLGSGNFSQVYKGYDEKRHREVAVKVVKYSSLTN